MGRRRPAPVRRAALIAALAVVAGSIGAAGAQAAPTRARARAIAAAVNLTAADLPGFTRSSSKATPGEQQFGAKLARCAGGANPARALVNIDSADFDRTSPGGIADTEASSNVTLMPSARLAAQDLAAARSARGRRCLVVAVDQLLAAMKVPHIKFGRVTLTRVQLQATGATGSFGLRFKVTATSAGLRIPFYIDDFGFTLGPVEVGLTTLGVLTRFPAADEQRLFSLLIGRAAANPA
jgi:hypothetical protein